MNDQEKPKTDESEEEEPEPEEIVLEEIALTGADDKGESAERPDKELSDLKPPPMAPPPPPPPPPPVSEPKKEGPPRGVGLGLRTELISELKEVLIKKGIFVETRTTTPRGFVQMERSPIPTGSYTPPTRPKTSAPERQEIGPSIEQKAVITKGVIDEIISLVSKRLKDEFSGLKDEIGTLKEDLSKKDDTLEAIETWLEMISLQKSEPVISDTAEPTPIQPSVIEEKIKPAEIKQEEVEKSKVALAEMLEFGKEYHKSVIEQAKALGQAFAPTSTEKPEPPISTEKPKLIPEPKMKEPKLEEIPLETKEIQAKTPVVEPKKVSKKVNAYFTSTIGPGEKKHKLLLDMNITVKELKDTVGNMYGLNPLNFHLSLGGITMDEVKTLMEYDINEGDDILIIPSSTAGFSK